MMKMYQVDGSLKDKKRPGRPRKLTEAEDEHMLAIHIEDRFRTPKETVNAMETNLSVWIVRRLLRERGMRARRPASKPKLKESHKEARLKWATIHRKWGKSNGEIFSSLMNRHFQ